MDSHMDRTDNADVERVFASYPEHIRRKLMLLRRLIFDAASESADIHGVQETLKWGEPSYLTKTGSTIRVGWKKSRPEQYAMYFNCNTPLVETFKELYGDKFKFEGKRAILFDVTDAIPVSELRHCISLSLLYHRIKHLPMLGA